MRTNTDQMGPSESEFRFRGFRIVVIDGPDKGLEAQSKGSELSIGTAPANQLVLSDPKVSRHHCTILVTPSAVLLQDLESTNGTQLAGHRIMLAHLAKRAAIEIGNTTLRFEPLEKEIGEPLSEDIRFDRVLGRSVPMRRIFALLERIAPSDSTVLLEGETGTGKGLIAHVLHRASKRAQGPLVVIDCASIPPTLIESELFGHVRGAFTGAHDDRAGAFESANGGTIFLDEIGELPLELQPKLLRALEDRLVKRVGAGAQVPIDVRVVAATNRDLRQAVNRGAFRSDLYYRLDIMRLRIPPLRDRREDIPMLVAHFFSELSDEPGPPVELIESCARHDWPGNVRELRSAVERAVVTGDPGLWAGITPDSEPAADPEAAAATLLRFDSAESFRVAKARMTAQWERWYLSQLLARHDGNVARAARAVKMDRTHLRDLVRRYGLKGTGD